MNKRGFEKQYIYLFYLILSIFVALTILRFVNEVRDDTRFVIQQLSIDSALLIDSVSAAPNDMDLRVSFAKEDYLLQFNSNPCYTQSNKKDVGYNPYAYPCFSNLQFKTTDRMDALFFNFNKTGNELKIENEKSPI